MRRCVAFVLLLLSHIPSQAEPRYSITQPSFPAPAQLELQLDAKERFLFSWQAVPDATLYHLQERRDNQDHFLDLAANLPATTQHYRITPSLYGRTDSRYRLLSCNATGCSQSNTLVLRINPDRSLADLMPPTSTDLFGAALSLNEDGTVLAVGAPTANIRHVKTGMGNGAVYVFQHHQGQWSTPTTLVSAVASPVDRFGYAIKLDPEGTVLSVDSQAKSNGARHDITQVFTYKPLGGWFAGMDSKQFSNASYGWHEQPISLSKDHQLLALTVEYEFFSQPLNRSAIDDYFSQGSVRSVYLFDQSKSLTAEPLRVKPSQQPQAQFGHAISLSGDGRVLAVGAPILTQTNDTEPSKGGGVYIYQRRADGQWRQQTYLRSTAALTDRLFGYSLSLNGDGSVLAVSSFDQSTATQDDLNANNPRLSSGLVQLFTRTASTDWQLNTVLTAPSDHDWQAQLSRAEPNPAMGF